MRHTHFYKIIIICMYVCMYNDKKQKLEPPPHTHKITECHAEATSEHVLLDNSKQQLKVIKILEVTQHYKAAAHWRRQPDNRRCVRNSGFDFSPFTIECLLKGKIFLQPSFNPFSEEILTSTIVVTPFSRLLELASVTQRVFFSFLFFLNKTVTLIPKSLETYLNRLLFNLQLRCACEVIQK